MAKRLNDEQKKKIIADYVQTGSLRETARLNGNISPHTVKKIVHENSDITQLCTKKQEENTKNILDYMNSNYEKQKKIIDLCTDAIIEKLEKNDMFTNLKDISTVYGIIFDKALKYQEIQSKNQSNTDEINKNLLSISELINNPKQNREMRDFEDV